MEDIRALIFRFSGPRNSLTRSLVSIRFKKLFNLISDVWSEKDIGKEIGERQAFRKTKLNVCYTNPFRWKMNKEMNLYWTPAGCRADRGQAVGGGGDYKCTTNALQMHYKYPKIRLKSDKIH